MKLTVSGPNPHGGSFHVHKTGCADLKRGVYKRLNPADPFSECYEEDHDSAESVVLSVYDNGIMDENAPCTYEDYVGEFHFFPCTEGLPDVSGDAPIVVS